MMIALGSWADEMEDMPVPCKLLYPLVLYKRLMCGAAAGMHS